MTDPAPLNSADYLIATRFGLNMRLLVRPISKKLLTFTGTEHIIKSTHGSDYIVEVVDDEN